METKICTKCGKEKPIEEFGWRNKAKGTRRADCKECHSNYVKTQYHKRKDFIRDLKSQCSCAKCGETRGYVLDYHHINPEEKDGTIARLVSNNANEEKIKQEIAKCVVLCANCHREFHYLQERDNNLTILDYIK